MMPRRVCTFSCGSFKLHRIAKEREKEKAKPPKPVPPPKTYEPVYSTPNVPSAVRQPIPQGKGSDMKEREKRFHKDMVYHVVSLCLL